jgi:hypothetical protein
MFSLQETTSTSTQFMLQPMGDRPEHEGATTHALLKNVESVYIESMTQDDKVQELLRNQEKSEQQQRRQNEEMEKLRSQCQTATREIRKNQEVPHRTAPSGHSGMQPRAPLGRSLLTCAPRCGRPPGCCTATSR